MFSAHCPCHGRRVLLGFDHITAIRNGPDGIHLDWRCSCGGRGTLVTGRRRTATIDGE
jgi:hypothetical protein